MAETYDDRGQGGAVVLDIGDDVGALVLYTGEELRGREIEVSPKGRDAWRVHTAIRERQANGRTIFAGVYLALPADDYTIWRDATTPAGEVAVVGGAVAEADWRKMVGDASTPMRTAPLQPADGLSDALRPGPQPASLGPDPAGSANTGSRDSQTSQASSSRSAPPETLPPRYRTGKAVSAAPMGSAPMRYADDGRVAWDRMWTDFCDLALAGGPPHRDSVLGPIDPGEALASPDAYARVVAEIERGLRLVTGLRIARESHPGWVGLQCGDEAMAQWLTRAIEMENVVARRDDAVLLLPAGPRFTLDKEIKNVVTVVAKTHHYWLEHRDDREGR